MSKKLILMLLIVFIAGCANLEKSTSSEDSYEPLETYPEDDQFSTVDDINVNDSPDHMYYDFADIPVPNE
ncbi:MAG: hypothetical protein LC631_06960, partial [Desulfovibrionales bacterium]|nr:hypothetical protein [Desulfovibrionales bacterium]